MNEQQLAAVKQALEALNGLYLPGELDRVNKAITALQSIISQDALDKKAENARELGLSYDDGKPWPVAPVPNGPYSAPIKELWPVAPKPWVGLTDQEKYEAEEGCSYMDEFDSSLYADNIEQRLKEKNT